MPKHILIIGANKGIGLELCRQYTQAGNHVIATCRSASQELKAVGCKVIENIEVTSDESMQSLQKALADRKLDILIHNAGILKSDQYPDIDFDNMREHFEVNSLAPLRAIQTLESLLSKGSKVGIVSSRVGSIDDNSGSNNYAYRVSKTAVNMIGKCLSIDLAPKGIALVLLHPGYVKTDMTNNNGLITPQESATGLIRRMEELSIKTSGTFVHSSGEKLMW